MRRRGVTFSTEPWQKPVPRSTQTSPRSSYTLTLRGPSDSASCITVGRNSGDMTTGCSSISDLRSGDEDVAGFWWRDTASSGSVEVGVVGGEDESCPFETLSLEAVFALSVSFDTFII